MANDKVTVYCRGTLDWAKVIGEPREKTGEYADGSREWTFDFTPDNEDVFVEHGITKKLRDPKGADKRTKRFITFRQSEFNSKGEKNAPIIIKDKFGELWDGSLIGNGTKADVKFQVRDYGKGKPKGVYIRAIRVLDLVPYKVDEFAPLDSDDEFFAEPTAPLPSDETPDFEEDFGLVEDALDDDIPE